MESAYSSYFSICGEERRECAKGMPKDVFKKIK